MQRTHHSSIAGEQLARIYRQHADAAYRFAYSCTENRHDAEDLLQGAFLALYERLTHGERIEHPRAWLATAIRRRSINMQRGTRAHADSYDEVAASSGDADDLERLEQVRVVLAGLPRAQREAFVLRHWTGLSQREIAATLAVTESAVESLLARARARIVETTAAAAAVAVVGLSTSRVSRALASTVPGFAATMRAATIGTAGAKTAVPVLAKAAAAAFAVMTTSALAHAVVHHTAHRPALALHPHLSETRHAHPRSVIGRRFSTLETGDATHRPDNRPLAPAVTGGEAPAHGLATAGPTTPSATHGTAPSNSTPADPAGPATAASIPLPRSEAGAGDDDQGQNADQQVGDRVPTERTRQPSQTRSVATRPNPGAGAANTQGDDNSDDAGNSDKAFSPS